MNRVLSRLFLFGAMLKSTILHASIEETNQVVSNSNLLLEPTSIAIGIAVSMALALISTLIYIIIKAISYTLKYNPGNVASYMLHWSNFIKKSDLKSYEFWSGTTRMKVTKVLFDMLVLLTAMTLVRSITLSIITEGFSFSYDFITFTMNNIVAESSGDNLSNSILSVFTLIMIVRIFERKSQPLNSKL